MGRLDSVRTRLLLMVVGALVVPVGLLGYLASLHFVSGEGHLFLREAGWLEFGGLGLAVLLVLMGARLFAERTVLGPVAALVEATRRLAQGEHGVCVESPAAGARGELGELARAFNALSFELGQRERLLEAEISEHRRAEERAQRQARHAEALAHAASRLNAQLDVPTILREIGAETSRALSVPIVIARLLEPARNELRVALAQGLPEGACRRFGPLSQEAVERIFERQTAVSFHELQTAAGLEDHELYRELDMTSGAMAAMRRDGEVLGTLAIATREPRTLLADELELLSGLAHEAASAITNARLFEGVSRNLRRTRALREIDRAIANSVDLKVILRVVAHEAVEQLRADAAAVLVIGFDGQSLCLDAAVGFSAGPAVGQLVPLHGSLAGRVAEERRMVVFDDVAREPSLTGERTALAGEGFSSYLGVPLMVRGEVQGVLELHHRSRFELGTEELAFLDSLAAQAAVAVSSSGLLDDLRRSNRRLAEAYEATIAGWSRALDMRDHETQGHSDRVTTATLYLAGKLGIGGEELVHMRRGALLHDIGKMGVPDRILLKRGALTDQERAIIRRHPELAFEMLAPIEFLRPALDIPWCHHERWDGTGYPRGLSGKQIPLAARIFAVVDVWDALRSPRPYRDAWPAAQVREHLRTMSGKHFEPEIVERFLALEPEHECLHGLTTASE